MSGTVGQVLAGIMVLGIIYMLVRPGSPGSDAVKTIGDALSALTRAATGFHYTGPGSNISGGSGNPTLSA